MTDRTQDLARQPQQSQPLAASRTATALCDIPPATLKQGTSELGACLTLVSPSGLTSDDRKEWLAVAMQTLSGIPADLLERGCSVARRTCKFPSEIVPTIMAEVEVEWHRRKRRQHEDAMREANRNAPRLPEPDLVDPAEIRKLLRSLGA